MTKVLVAGSFDILHTGHIFFLKEAAKLGDVSVIVARDKTILKVKGKLPILPENQRLELIKAIRYVKEAVLGNIEEHFLVKAIALNPDIIFLGPNQKYDIDQLKKELEERDAGHIQIHRLKQLYSIYELQSSTSIKKKIKDQ